MKQRVSVLNLQDNEKTNQSNSEDKKVRLQVALAHSGVASRRACEKIITDGRVTVNGEKVIELGTKVSPEDVICVDGKQVFLEATKRYVLLNKPIGYVCSLSEENERPDEPARNLAIDLLKPHFSERLYNVGRLDMYSSGLILFTNDGDFASVVSHPSAELEKEYIVETSMPYPRYLPEKFMRGVRVDGVFYKCRFAEGLSSHKMRVVLIEGKNREIRRVIESFDLRVKSLERVRIGFITADLPGGGVLGTGEYRELSESEVKKLIELCRKNKETPFKHSHTREDAAQNDYSSGKDRPFSRSFDHNADRPQRRAEPRARSEYNGYGKGSRSGVSAYKRDASSYKKNQNSGRTRNEDDSDYRY